MEPALPGRPPPEFTHGDVVLRALATADWPVEQQLSGCADVVRWTTIPGDLSEDQARQRVERGLALVAEGRLARYVIVDGGSVVGTCGVGALGDAVEVFYAILPEARGRGLATLAATILATWARDAGATAVTLLTFPDNLASQRVAERAGFKPTGELTRSVKGVDVTLLSWRLAG